LTPRTWPPKPDEIRTLIAAGETPLVEFKEAWYDLAGKAGKAEFAKDIIALANTAELHKPAYLIVGPRDRKHGGGLLALDARIDAEQVGQILNTWVIPPPDVRVQYARVDDDEVAVLGVFGSSHIYQSARAYENWLEPNVPYVRRLHGVGRLTLVEIQDRLLARTSARAGVPLAADPLEFGVVERGRFSGPHGPTVRVTNVSDEPVADVSVVFDICWMRDRTVCTRDSRLSLIALGPGESRETELQLRTLSLIRAGKNILNMEGSEVGLHWLDVTVIVRFRDRRGFLQERYVPLTIAE
jgi:hypothetical protein